MPEKKTDAVILHQGFIFKTNLLASKSPENIVILIHGWNGNENSMNIFIQDIPDTIGFIAPRGFYPTQERGYTWAPSLVKWEVIQESKRSSLSELLTSVKIFKDQLENWFNFLTVKPETIDLVGFSQGGALSLLLGLSYPELFNRIACISGFLPVGYKDVIKMNWDYKNKILVSHGLSDEIIPVEVARSTTKNLSALGFDVEYCEENAGHKISSECRNKLRHFLQP
jgi:phospholipase/carboxylesterase